MGMATNVLRTAGMQVLLLKERMRSGVAFNPLAGGTRENPFPAYARLRGKDPVHWSELMKMWVLSRHADVQMVLRDPRFVAEAASGDVPAALQAEANGAFFTTFQRSLLALDPPDHTRLRALAVKAFTPRAIEAMRPRIEAIVDDLLEPAIARGHLDIIADLANPLPVIVIAEMLGVPSEDRAQFKAWSDDIAEGLEPLLSPEQLRRANTSTAALVGYFRAIINERRRQPHEDLLSALVAAEEQGDRLNEDELLSMCVLLLGAGNETTTNLIGNGMLALLRNPEQLERLRAEPSLLPGAVEELLRYDSPVQMTTRTAAEDVEIGGRPVRRGQMVLALLGAANRDPAQFPDPERLDVTRTAGRHLAFGQGIHYCLGAPLARVEGQIAIRELLARAAGLRLAGKPRWRDTVVLRGLRTLPVACAAAEARRSSAA